METHVLSVAPAVESPVWTVQQVLRLKHPSDKLLSLSPSTHSLSPRVKGVQRQSVLRVTLCRVARPLALWTRCTTPISLVSTTSIICMLVENDSNRPWKPLDRTPFDPVHSLRILRSDSMTAVTAVLKIWSTLLSGMSTYCATVHNSVVLVVLHRRLTLVTITPVVRTFSSNMPRLKIPCGTFLFRNIWLIHLASVIHRLERVLTVTRL